VNDRHLPPDLSRLMDGVTQAFFDVYNELGYGLSERIYMTALGMVLEERGFLVAREVIIDITFHGRRIGFVKADMLVDDQLFVEGKTGPTMPLGSKQQLFNYVSRGHKRIGLLLFFGPSPEFKRVIHSL
jgi:GxxExxY protein